ncbi:MAG: MerR family transcriptional regulator [Bifidobacteriaceae bacterium]|jgi:MerR family transcriptional regulator/heat shock protein HspR|nr:MerR family transcriptional regulator [Bifidobacteriaceae bacterium]
MYRHVPVEVIDDLNAAVLSVSQAAALAEIHPQTVRQYDRLGLIQGQRTRGKSRRFSLMDVEKLRQIQIMSQTEGINLNGIRRILSLAEENRILKRQLLAYQHDAIFSVSQSGETSIDRAHRKRQSFRSTKLLPNAQ